MLDIVRRSGQKPETNIVKLLGMWRKMPTITPYGAVSRAPSHAPRVDPISCKLCASPHPRDRRACHLVGLRGAGAGPMHHSRGARPARARRDRPGAGASTGGGVVRLGGPRCGRRGTSAAAGRPVRAPPTSPRRRSSTTRTARAAGNPAAGAPPLGAALAPLAASASTPAVLAVGPLVGAFVRTARVISRAPVVFHLSRAHSDYTFRFDRAAIDRPLTAGHPISREHARARDRPHRAVSTRIASKRRAPRSAWQRRRRCRTARSPGTPERPAATLTSIVASRGPS